MPHNRVVIYRFKSAATADLIMLGPHGDEVLRLIGREPAAKGIIEAADIDRAVAALEAAIAAQEATRAAPPAGDPGGDERDAAGEPVVALRRRLWPLIEMLRRAAGAGEPVVWGV